MKLCALPYLVVWVTWGSTPALRHLRNEDRSALAGSLQEASRASLLVAPGQAPANLSAAACAAIALYPKQPSLCMRGSDWASTDELRAFVQTFAAEQAAQLKVFPKHCCMGTNHQFAMAFLVKKLQPAVIIESGVAAGQGTYLLRGAAGPNTQIFALDPGDPAVVYKKSRFGYWKDPSGATKYLVGTAFQDFAEVDWGQLIPDPSVRARTLVILDDHQSCVMRFRAMQKWGIRYAFYEDNFPAYVAQSQDKYTCPELGSNLERKFPEQMVFGDAFTPNAACTAWMKPQSLSAWRGDPFPTDYFLYKDKFGLKCRMLSRERYATLVRYMQSNMKTYFEFPPLYSPCSPERPPLLADAKDLLSYGLPSLAKESWQYGHYFPAFVELEGSTRNDPGDPLDARTGGIPGSFSLSEG